MAASGVYEPFSSLVNTIWWLTIDQYQLLLGAWCNPDSFIAHQSLSWFHPLHPSFETCFTLVVLHSNQVMGDQTADVLYSSLFGTQDLLPPQVYAFKRSMVAFGLQSQLQAYEVRSTTEFVPLSFSTQQSSLSRANQGWPVSTIGKNGRVIYFVSISDLPLMEQQFSLRRKSFDTNGDECMFVHRCIHVKVSQEDPVLTTSNETTTVTPFQYFRPLVSHFLSMKSWNDQSPYSDNVQGRASWKHCEQQHFYNLFAPPPPPPPLSPPPTPHQQQQQQQLSPLPQVPLEIEQLLQEIDDRELQVWPSDVPQHQEEDDDDEADAVAAACAAAAAAVESSPEEMTGPNMVVLGGYFNAPIIEDEEDEDVSGGAFHAANVNLSHLTAFSMPKESRRALAMDKYSQLVSNGVFVHEDLLLSFRSRANLEGLLRVFFAMQSKFSQNVDSLEAFIDPDMLVRLVQLLPYVTTQYFGTDDDLYEKWVFALYLSSRSFFYSLYSLGYKDSKYLECDRGSRAAKELMLDENTSLHASDKWSCSLCSQVHQSLPTVQRVFERQLQHSHWIHDNKADYPCSRCCICLRSLSDHVDDFVEKVRSEEEPEEEDDDLEMRFRLRTFPYYNTFAFAQLSCKCMSRDYCLSCLAEVHAVANLKNDRQTGYDEEDSWCLCLQSSPEKLGHFNVLLRGQHAALSALTSMQLRLCYIWYRQLHAQMKTSGSAVAAGSSYRNVILMFYSPVMDDEPQLTDCFQGNQVFSVDDGLCVQVDRVGPDEVHEVEFCLCLQRDTLISAIEAHAHDLLDGRQGRRLRVICCRLDAYVESAMHMLQDSLFRHPLLAMVCTDSVMQTASRELATMYARFDTPRKSVLFSRCTATGKLMSM